jgi:hypothetical protein
MKPLYIALVRTPIVMNMTGNTAKRISDITQPLKKAKKIPEKLIEKESRIVPIFSPSAF